MKTSFFLLASALLFSTAASAQSFLTVPDEQELVGVPTPAAFQRPAQVTYFEAAPSQDAANAQYAELRQAFAASKPTLVFYQGPDLGVASTEAATINQFGEGGYVRYLAQQHQAAAERLDDPLAEYAYLRTRIAPEPLKLYCLLRQTQWQRQQHGFSKRLTIRSMQQLLINSRQFLPGTEQAIQNLGELAAAYQKYCPASGHWWQADAAWFGPPATATRSATLDEINQAIGEFRQQSLRQKLAAPALAGQRVLVVTRPGYLPAAPAAEPVAAR
ncbi:MAG: hypothetical protein ACRYFX_22820 [Janthinobacterium lividum]